MARACAATLRRRYDRRMKIYLSSTYLDLASHRAVVAKALRKARYDVVMMEEYVARDARVEFACRGDVAGCDAYVGVFAWRYGYVPEDDNPGRLSVTEMEYTAAGDKKVPRLTFLLDDKARWPADRKDADLARISALRTRLKKQCSAYFGGAHELAVEVLAAAHVLESTSQPQPSEAIDEMVRAQELGSSYMLNIRDKLDLLGRAPFIELRLGPTPWWNTRLHLVTALAQEFASVQGLALVDGNGQFVAMATPAEVRYRLGRYWPVLEQAYAEFRREAPTLNDVKGQLWRYPSIVSLAMKADEQTARHVLEERDIGYELGLARNAEIVTVTGKSQSFLQNEILGRQLPFVALVRDGKLEGLVDRGKLALRLAQRH